MEQRYQLGRSTNTLNNQDNKSNHATKGTNHSSGTPMESKLLLAKSLPCADIGMCSKAFHQTQYFHAGKISEIIIPPTVVVGINNLVQVPRIKSSSKRSYIRPYKYTG